MTALMLPAPTSTTDPGALAEQLFAPAAPITRRLVMFGGIAFVLILLWAAFVPFSSGAVASGQLEVIGRRKTVQNLDGGIIAEIRVREGQQVAQGALLLRLNDADARLNVSVLQTQMDSLRAEQAAREAEVAGRSTVSFPADLQARGGDIGVAAILASQRAAFAARRESARGSRSGLGQRVAQLGEDSKGAAAQRASRAAQIALLDREIANTQYLVDKGYATLPRLYALQRAAAALRGEQEALDRQQASLAAQGSQTRIQSGQVDRERSVSAADALRSIQGELVQVVEKLTVARQILARKEVRAPVAGRVVALQVSTIGGVIRPGDPLMDIVPSSRQLIIRARLSPLHADDVRIGQQAYVRFQGLGAKSTPEVAGKVEAISADALADQRTGEQYFDVRVSIPDTSVAQLPKDFLRPGLPAEALIQTGQRTLLAYLFAPLSNAAFHSMRE